MPSAPSSLIRASRVAFVALGLITLAGCQSDKSADLEGRTPDGTVTMAMVQGAFIGSASGGSGTLVFRGRSYPFTIGGVGIGGVGGSSIQAEGEVYGLSDVAQFPGTYAKGRVGFAIGTTSAGQFWLQNTNGVIMHLHASCTGLILSLGGDAILVTMNQ